MPAGRPWRASSGGIARHVRVTPRGIEDRGDGPVFSLRVRVAAEAGAANEAARRLVAQALGCPASAVFLQSGAHARTTVLGVEL